MNIEFLNVKFIYDMEMYYSGQPPTFEEMMLSVVEYVESEFCKFSLTYKVERSTFICSWTEDPRTPGGKSTCVSFYGGTAWKAMFKLWVFLDVLGGAREGLHAADQRMDERNAEIKDILKQIMLEKRT